ncbi:uncharacterized protein B0P05DRAFT_554936 [Gilbertella persicaria]|uniref:uncharacterized protein n=1 Tax=Gilbertella persicaria TaxID=101096 RepID=UPI00221FA7C4|nr:uncharacterized protein B0P05DRAFT_554936 [Gilbertella persicaria]KAI8064316.1 hypothetical protein B0P05DRAFT_554936 [Gilbertella persicaria]
MSCDSKALAFLKEKTYVTSPFTFVALKSLLSGCTDLIITKKVVCYKFLSNLRSCKKNNFACRFFFSALWDSV